jgi:hypothetical protein
MKIIKAKKEYAGQISRLMMLDLENPNPKFPKDIIEKFRNHAKEENILKEFDNPNLIAVLALNEETVKGFIVGYRENEKTSMIHYITAENIDIKKELFDAFILECKTKEIDHIKTDAFEFMENNEFYKSQGFTLVKKEQMNDNLEMLWYELKLNKEVE